MRSLANAGIVFGLMTVVACSGGGGGTPAAPVVQLPPGTTMTLDVQIAQGLLVNSTARVPQASRVKADATPTAAPQQVLFGVPDSYVQIAPLEFEMSAYVSLNLPAGAAFPSPAPSVAWTQTGAAVTIDGPSNFTDPTTGLLSSLDADPGHTVGETRITATVAGVGSAEVDIYNYHAFGMNGLYGFYSVSDTNGNFSL